MEIRDYFRRTRRAIGLLILLPLLAGAGAYSILHNRPQLQEATATLETPPSSATGNTQIGLFEADFDQQLNDFSVISKVSQATAVSAADLRHTLSASRVGTSTEIRVTLRSSASSVSTQRALRMSVQLVLSSLAGRDIPQLQRQVRLATDQVNTAQSALDQYQRQHGSQFANEQSQSITNQIVSDLTQLSVAQSTGDAAGAAQLNQQLKSLKAQRLALSSQLQQTDALTVQITAAQATLQSARQQLIAGQASAETDSSPSLILDVSASSLSKTTPLIEGVGVAIALAFALGLVLIVGPDLLRRNNAADPQPRDVRA
jgi:hypothetical protein